MPVYITGNWYPPIARTAACSLIKERGIVYFQRFMTPARILTVPDSRFTSIEKDTMQTTKLLAATLLLIGASQLQAQGPGAGQPTGGVGPGTSNGRTDGNPTPTGPGTDKPMDDKPMNDKMPKKKKDKRAGTPGTQGGAIPGSSMPDPAASDPGTNGRPTPGGKGAQSGSKPNDAPNMNPGMAPQGPSGSPAAGTPPMP